MRSLIAAGVPVTVAVGSVDVEENVAGDSVAAFSSRGLAFGGGLKPDIVAAGVAVPTSEPGRGEEGEVRFGTVSGTSVAAAVAAGAAAVLAEGRPRVDAAGLHALLVGSAQRRDLDAAASGAGLLDLRTAVQQESSRCRRRSRSARRVRDALALERTVTSQNVSTRPLEISVQTVALAPKGVEITVDPERDRARARRSARRSSSRGHERTLRPRRRRQRASSRSSGRASDVHIPWAVAVPTPGTDLVSAVSLKATAGRVSDATPVVLSLVAGAIVPRPGPQLVAVESLEVQLRRGDELLGILARRRELLPGRYTFGLTGRGPGGERLAARELRRPRRRAPGRRPARAGGGRRVPRALR